MPSIFDDERRRNGGFQRGLLQVGLARLGSLIGDRNRDLSRFRLVGPKSPLNASKMLDGGRHRLALFSCSATISDTNAVRLVQYLDDLPRFRIDDHGLPIYDHVLVFLGQTRDGEPMDHDGIRHNRADLHIKVIRRCHGLDVLLHDILLHLWCLILCYDHRICLGNGCPHDQSDTCSAR